MTPPLLICTRFGLSIKDRAWFEHRLPLISSITLPSLLAQDDQEFRWALFVDPDLPPSISDSLEEMLAVFDGRAFLYPRPYNSANFLALAGSHGGMDAGGYALTARIDDDDAWNVGTIGEVRSRATSWLRNPDDTQGLCLTFANGLEWIMYDMLDVDALQQKGVRITRNAAVRPFPFPFQSMSVFVCSKVDDGISAISAGHREMGTFLSAKGYRVDIIPNEEPMWLYSRHKQVQTSVQRARTEEVEVSLTELEREFGIDRTQTEQYIEAAGEYGYSVMKRTDFRLSNLSRELGGIRNQIKKTDADEPQMAELKKREAELAAKIAHMSANVVGDPEDTTTQAI